MEWTNPHTRLHITVNEADGRITNWQFEMRAPNVLARCGWGRTSLRPGDSVIIEGYRAKDGTNTAIAEQVTMEVGSERRSFQFDRCAIPVTGSVITG